MYRVIEKFADLQDANTIYEVGDTYPRKGSNPSAERIKALAGSGNKIGRPLIVAVEEKPKPQRRKKAE